MVCSLLKLSTRESGRNRGEQRKGCVHRPRQIGSLAKLYGAIIFIVEHPKETDQYLNEQDERWEDFKARNPLSPGMIERFERAKRELSVKPSGLELSISGRR